MVEFDYYTTSVDLILGISEAPSQVFWDNLTGSATALKLLSLHS